MVEKEKNETNGKEDNKKVKNSWERIKSKIFRFCVLVSVYSGKIWKTINTSVAAPVICYIILFFASILFLVIAAFIKESPIVGILTNIGYGVFCSTCVAALVDYGTTRRKKERDSYIYYVMTQKLKRAIHRFIVFRLELNNSLDSEIASLKYSKWATHLFIQKEDENEEYKDRRELFIGFCESLLSRAEAIKEYSSVLAGNNSLKENFFYDLDELINCARFIVHNRNIGKYHSEELFSIICRIFPEYYKVFQNDWDNQSMSMIRIKEHGSWMQQDLAFFESERSVWH